MATCDHDDDVIHIVQEGLHNMILAGIFKTIKANQPVLFYSNNVRTLLNQTNKKSI